MPAPIPQSRTIGEFEYTVTPLGSKVGQRMLVGPILHTLGPILAGVGTARDLKHAIILGLSGVVERLSEIEFEAMAETLAASTTVLIGEKRPSLATVYALQFAGNYGALFKWFAFALEVNFGSFFHELKQELEERWEARQAAEKAAAVPVDSASPATTP